MSFKAGFVGLIGLPNAGKSSLVNKILGDKVSIVSQKPQTTRQRVLGLYNTDESQIIFVDTPGLVESETGINPFLKEELHKIIDDVDVLVAVLNSDAKDLKQLEKILTLVEKQNKPWLIIQTKSDLKFGVDLTEILASYNVPKYKLSVLKKKENIFSEFLPAITQLLPENPAPLFDNEILTTQTIREMCSEIIREKCFNFIHQEIPYSLAVKIQKYVENPNHVTKIYADIIVSKNNHKAIVVGQGGQLIRHIGKESRKEIERLIGHQVYLELFVQAKPNWFTQSQTLKELGYSHVDA